MSAHDYGFLAIDGGDLPLSAWRGRPVLIVNTASFCGYTPQYEGLEALWRSCRKRGLVVLGVPSNDFGAQEPGSDGEIKAFCAQYQVSFPLTRKVRVTGREAHPFYRWLASELGERGVPRWNFHKYLIDGEGRAVGAWASSTGPQSKDIAAAIDPLLPAGN